MEFQALWDKALTFETYVQACKAEHCGLWMGIYKLARIPDWALAAVPPTADLKLLVISEDWCGDASNTVPVLARLADMAPGLELRVVRRDEHPELMDRYLTDGSRSIPIVVALDGHFQEIGHWGPRPTQLQAWVMASLAGGTSKAVLYPQVRKWYATDRGQTTIREVLEAAGFPASPEAGKRASGEEGRELQ